jgi:tetratricopeptide (TPR) repeat protein
MSFSPDGDLLAASTYNHYVHLWNLRALRSRLAAMGLDWELPPYPEPPQPAETITGIEFELGELDVGAPGASAREAAPLSGLLDSLGRTVEGSIEVFRKGLRGELDGRAAAAFLARRGREHARQGRVEDALADLDGALELDPAATSARFSRGFLLGRAGRHREAIDAFRELAEEDPENPDFLNGLAWQYLTAPGDLGSRDEAMKLSLRAVALIEKRGETAIDRLFLALGKSALGLGDEAREDHERALRWRRERADLAPAAAANFDTVLAEVRRVLGIEG